MVAPVKISDMDPVIGTLDGTELLEVTKAGDTRSVTSQQIANLTPGSTVPGANKQVVFNDSGSFGANAGMTYDKTTHTFTLGEALDGGSDANITTPDAAFADSPGNDLNITLGDGTDAERGGNLAINGGGDSSGDNFGAQFNVGGADPSQGGDLEMHAGAAAATGANGGEMTIQGGNAGDGDGGNARIKGGTSVSGTPGSVIVEVAGAVFLEVTPDGELEIGGDPGTAGQVATSAGPGLPISWEDAGGGGFNFGLNGVWSQVNAPGGTQWRVTFDDSGYAPVEQSGNGTQNHPFDTSATTDFNSLNYRFCTASGAPRACSGFRSGGSDAQHFFKTSASAANSGGFKRSIIFGVLVQDNDGQAFFGECVAGENPCADGLNNPSTFFNTFGFGKDDTDANLQFMHNDGSGVAVKVDTGVTVASLIGKILKLEIDVPRGGASATARLIDAGTGTTLAENTAVSEIPVATISMDWCVAINNGATVTQVRLGVSAAFLGYPD